ncbi:MAG TPA: lytic transglycosylase domain-containing protein [Streptosporangiaceae bacterium]
MSQHRRRLKARRPKRRRVGVFLVTAAAATVTVTGISVMIIVGNPGTQSDPLGAAVAQVSTGRSGVVLEQERQQVILEDAATESFSVTSAPKITHAPPPPSSSSSNLVPSGPPPDPSSAQGIAYNMLPSFGFSTDQFGCLNDIWTRESGWRYNAENASGAYGIPQALPGSKMASAGADWQTDPTTQIKWGLGYIKSVYGTPCDAWSFWQAHSYY